MDPEGLRRLTERPGPGQHRVVIRLGEDDVETLADLPPARGGVLFVDLAPSTKSVSSGHHQQDEQGRLFWRRLIRAGLLPEQTRLETADDALVAMGHGIATLVARPFDGESGRGPAQAELAAGVGPLWQRIALWRPAAVVFVSQRAAETVAGRPLPVPWGVLHGVAIAGRPCVLLPAPDAATEVESTGIDLLRNLSVSLPR